MPADLNILAKYSGANELTRLEQHLLKINRETLRGNQLSKFAQVNNNVQIQQLARKNAQLRATSNLSNKEINNLAVQTALNQELTFVTENRLRVATEAFNLRRLYAQEGIVITQQESMVATKVGQEIIAIEQAKAAAYNQTRKALMGASISMFVLNISLGQLVTAMKPFVEGNKEAEQGLKDIQGALQFTLAPMQAYMAVQMIQTSLTKAQTAAMMKFGASLGAAFFWFQALNAQSAGVRATYFAIASALTVVAIASWGAAAGVATLQTLLGNPLAMVGLIGGIALLMGVIGAVTAPKAQTLTGHRKRVRSGGTAILDDDEVITRESKDGTRSGGGGDTNIFLSDSYSGTLSDSKITADVVRRYTQTGQGSIQFKRKVTSNG